MLSLIQYILILFFSLSSHISEAFVAEKGTLWKPNQTLYIHLLDANKKEFIQIKTIAQEWLKYTSLKPQFIMGKPTKKEVTHIRIQLGKGILNNSSRGTRALLEKKTEATMHLVALRYSWISEKRKRRLILHEFGHALGLLHEFENPTLPYQWTKKGLTQICKGIFKPLKKCVLKLTQKNKDIFFFSTFDQDSILNYEILPYMTREGVHIKKTYKLSDKDIKGISLLYPKKKNLNN